MNPLIQKWEELNKKKEEPAPIDNKIQYELDPKFVEQLKDVNTLSTLSVIGNSGPAITAASNYYTATNSTINYKPKPVTTYDVDSCNDSYFQVAEQIKNGKARVTNMSMEQGWNSSYFPEKKVIFEVALYD
jgi:hypothetical protein